MGNFLTSMLKLASLLLVVTSSTALALSAEVVDKKLPASSGGKLVVEVDFGTIDVTGTDAREVTLNASRKISAASDAKEKEYVDAVPITFTAEGNTIYVRARRAKGSNWSWGGHSRNEASYTLHVPRNFSVALGTAGGTINVAELIGEVKSDTSGGSLRFTHIRGPVNGDTSGGNIIMSDCEGILKVDTSGGKIEVTGGKGSLNADTSGGHIAVRNFAGDTRVSTSGGGLTLENVVGSLNGETSGGSIKAVLASPLPGDVKLTTSAGSIDIRVASNAAFNLDAQTSLGRVNSDLPVTTTSTSRDGLRGTVNGGGKAVHLRTSVGSIHVRPAGT